MKTTMTDFYKSLLVFVFMGIQPAMYAQPTYDALSRVATASAEVYASKGHEALGEHLGRLVDGANAFMESLTGYTAPAPALLVLSQADWGTYTNSQLIYGMPHYTPGGNTLIVAAEDNDFWRANMPPLDQLPAHLQQMFRNVYTNDAGELSVRPFFDLLALHELGHGWTGHHQIRRQRFWLEEVFVNIFLHTYIAEEQSQLLPGLEVLPMLNAMGGSDRFQYTTLDQFEEGYWIIGRDAPVNYGWYQFRFHFAAKQVYDQAGPEALKNLWAFLAGQTEALDDEALLNGLHEQVHPAMADVLLNWDLDR